MDPSFAGAVLSHGGCRRSRAGPSWRRRR